MPIERVTIGKTTWAKLINKLERPEHAAVFRELKLTKVSHPPSGTAVLWEPSPDLRNGLRSILEREETFVRRKGTCSHQEMLDAIKKLKA